MIYLNGWIVQEGQGYSYDVFVTYHGHVDLNVGLFLYFEKYVICGFC